MHANIKPISHLKQKTTTLLVSTRNKRHTSKEFKGSLRNRTNALCLTFTVIHNQNRVRFLLPSLPLVPTVIESSRDKTAIHRSVLENGSIVQFLCVSLRAREDRGKVLTESHADLGLVQGRFCGAKTI